MVVCIVLIGGIDMKKLVSFDYSEVEAIRDAIIVARRQYHERAINSLRYSKSLNFSLLVRNQFLNDYNKSLEMVKKFDSLLVVL